ncbi:MAG TPA: nucleotidyltransferase family protein [Thermoanaerobaculia bacterium]|nr:nucleotidyltransferase family protein [Thermoanaerobaculia bacterium]
MPPNEQKGLDAKAQRFYRKSLDLLNASGIPYMVGGAYAFARYTGIERHTKDFDLFLKREDYERIASVLQDAGFKTDLTFPHWLGKAHHGDYYIDLIYGSGNGVTPVDELWFEHAVDGEVLETGVKLIPAEEMIWSKAFIMERERYDGADVAHVLRDRSDQLDWHRLLFRFGRHWRVLLSHLMLFGFIYPGERSKIPAWLMQELTGRLQAELSEPDASTSVCYGTVISRGQYLDDTHNRAYDDARLEPLGGMTSGEITHWTDAIDREG